MKHGGGGVMVWGCFAGDTVCDLFRIHYSQYSGNIQEIQSSKSWAENLLRLMWMMLQIFVGLM
jgi:hypothetical protein